VAHLNAYFYTVLNTSEEIKKHFYTISELAAMFNVNASLIRFWETEFPLLTPTKNKKGNRLYTTKDIDNFKMIYQLVKVEGFTLQGAKEHLKHKKHKTNPISESKLNSEMPIAEAESKDAAIARLQAIRQELIQMKAKINGE
jgi:DNA-binding transcriptional MerR regulator